MTTAKAQEPTREFKVGQKVTFLCDCCRDRVGRVVEPPDQFVVIEMDGEYRRQYTLNDMNLVPVPDFNPQDAAREAAAEYTYITSLGPMPSDG